MSDIFREVDEALQQEKAAKLWKEYGPTLLAGAVVLVIATAISSGFIAWNAHRNGQETARLVEALESGTPSPAALQEIANDTRNKHEALALLAAGGVLADKGDYAPASALYKQAYEAGGPADIEHLARVMYVRTAFAAGGDTKADEMLDVLKPVLRDNKSPWQWPAKIDAALIEAHLNKNYAAAVAHLDGADDAIDLPPSLAQRASALSQLYSAQAAAAEPKKDPQG